MRKIFFLLTCMIVITSVSSQNKEQLPRYYFDEFEKGFICFSNDKPSTGLMNYNFETQKIQFIVDEQIYDFNNTPEVTHAEIGNVIFVPVKTGFAAVVYDGPVALLVLKHFFSDEVKRDGYGNIINTASVQNANYFSSTTSTSNLKYLDVERNYKTKISYFLMKEKKIYSANKSGFFKCFPNNKEEISKSFSKKYKNQDEPSYLINLLKQLSKQ